MEPILVKASTPPLGEAKDLCSKEELNQTVSSSQRNSTERIMTTMGKFLYIDLGMDFTDKFHKQV
jgi:hypothetical protein